MQSVIVGFVAFIIGFGVGVWYSGGDISDSVQSVGTSVSETVRGTATGGAPASMDEAPEGSINIGANMTAEQRAMAQNFGLNPDSLIITPSARGCIEAKIGKERMDAIAAGATPTSGEMMQALPCLNE